MSWQWAPAGLVTGGALGTIIALVALALPRLAVRILPEHARDRWAGCWLGEVQELTRRKDTIAEMWFSCGLVVAAVRLRSDARRRYRRGQSAELDMHRAAVDGGTEHVTPCPQSPESLGELTDQSK
jgi:hypothetical protein